jgi:DNA recombination protein RmuC
VAALSKKGYWRELSGSPDFVVMFVPGDQFIDAALARRPELLDKAAEQNVILASPSTLIGLLRAVAVGWREQRLAKEAAALFELGKELHERAAVAMGYATGLGKAINQAVEKYNSFVASMESRLVPTLRRFEEAGVKSGKELGELVEVEVRARGVAMPLLVEEKVGLGEK